MGRVDFKLTKIVFNQYFVFFTGDHAYKQNKSLSLPEQMISPQPDIRTLEIDPEKDSWMILACDGIWNFMSSQEVVDYVNKKIDNTPHDKLSSICEEVISVYFFGLKPPIHTSYLSTIIKLL